MRTMTNAILQAGAITIIAAGFTQAAIHNVDISPLGGAANLGTNTYTQDHAVGLEGSNENPQNASTAGGNEIGAGIVYDDILNQLTFNFGYGSDHGFGNLQGNISDAHIHGPGAVNFPSLNTSAGVVQALMSFHTPGSNGLTGSFSGSAILSAANETNLFNNGLYINLHSASFGGGEIRGQLIVVPEPASLGLIAGFALLARRRQR